MNFTKKCLFTIVIIGFAAPMLAMKQTIKSPMIKQKHLSIEERKKITDKFESIFLIAKNEPFEIELMFFPKEKSIPLTTENGESMVKCFFDNQNKHKLSLDSNLSKLKKEADKFVDDYLNYINLDLDENGSGSNRFSLVSCDHPDNNFLKKIDEDNRLSIKKIL